MAQLRIKDNVRIGHIYECEFGLYKKHQDNSFTHLRDEACETDYNHRIPNEMIKKRPIVVVGKHRGQYLVVPISATKETAAKVEKEPANKGIHILLLGDDFPVTERYSADTPRWAKSNLVCVVDGGRLRDIRAGITHINAHKVSDETLSKIRKGIVISIGMRDLLT